MSDTTDLLARVDALQQLLRCYRTSGNPSEALFRRLDRTKLREQAIRAALEDASPRPEIVVLCGSTRFPGVFHAANLRETLAGRIVLSIGCDTKSDADLAAAGYLGHQPDDMKVELDGLHFAKIDLADQVLILNQEGYVGESTQRELEYATKQGKRIRWWECPYRPETAAAPSRQKEGDYARSTHACIACGCVVIDGIPHLVHTDTCTLNLHTDRPLPWPPPKPVDVKAAIAGPVIQGTASDA